MNRRFRRAIGRAREADPRHPCADLGLREQSQARARSQGLDWVNSRHRLRVLRCESGRNRSFDRDGQNLPRPRGLRSSISVGPNRARHTRRRLARHRMAGRFASVAASGPLRPPNRRHCDHPPASPTDRRPRNHARSRGAGAERCLVTQPEPTSREGRSGGIDADKRVTYVDGRPIDQRSTPDEAQVNVATIRSPGRRSGERRYNFAPPQPEAMRRASSSSQRAKAVATSRSMATRRCFTNGAAPGSR